MFERIYILTFLLDRILAVGTQQGHLLLLSPAAAVPRHTATHTQGHTICDLHCSRLRPQHIVAAAEGGLLAVYEISGVWVGDPDHCGDVPMRLLDLAQFETPVRH